MKIREDFVTNSSSSSFVVIRAKNGYDKIVKDDDGKFYIGKTGHTEFGWEPRKYYYPDDRINWAYLQSEGKPEWREMLFSLLKDETGATEIVALVSDDYDCKNGMKYGYIDHQSMHYEDDANGEIFGSRSILRDFILGMDSFIQGGNDNG